MNLGLRSTTTRAVGAFLLAAALCLSVTTPAQAANIVLSTNGDGTAYGEAGGRITFPDRNSFKIADGWVNDYCEAAADGRGIYLYAEVALRNATKWHTKDLGLIGKDSNGGCGQTPVFFATLDRSFADEVRYVTLTLCEENRDVSTTCLMKAQKVYNSPRF